MGVITYMFMEFGIVEYLTSGIDAGLPGYCGAGLGDAGGRDIGDSQRQGVRRLGSGVNGALQ